MILRNFYKLAGACLTLLIVGSCGRSLVPSGKEAREILEFDKDAFNYYYVEGVKMKLGGDAGNALKYFEECLRLNPRSDGTYYQIAQILAAGGDAVNAKKFLKKAIGIDGRNAWYLMMLSGIYYQEGKTDSAIVYYEMIVKADSSSESNLLALGNLYSESRRFEEAGRIYEIFDRKYGINETSTVMEVNNLIELKKHDEAEEKTLQLLAGDADNIVFNGLLANVYRAAGQSDKALSVYKGLIERNPENGQVQIALCDFLLSEKNYEELFELLPAVLINNNVSREEKITFMAGMIEDSEIIASYGDKLNLSLMILEAGYRDDNIIPLMRPEYLARAGKEDDAAKRLEEIIRDFPQNYYAWEKLLLIYLQEGDFASLYKRAGECATLFNRSFLAKLLYANGAVETGNYEVATEELRKAEILAGSDRDMILQVITMRADLYYRTKQFDKSFLELERALSLNNEDLTILNNYAYYLAEQDRNLGEAEKMIVKVIEKEGDNTTFLDTYAWVLYKRGKLKDAARIMESIFAKGGNDAEYYEHYGYILMKQRKCNEAVLNWNKALELDKGKDYLKKEIENCIR